MNGNQVFLVALANVPTMITVLIGILINNSRMNDMNSRLSDMNLRFAEMRAHMDFRFDAMQSMWGSELHRVEEVLDARLKHLEDNR